MVSTVIDEPIYDWFRVVGAETQLEQGDILLNFPIMIPPKELAELPDEPVDYELPAKIPVERHTVVVMTQSCDLQKLRDEDEVILCLTHDYSEVYAAEPKYGPNKGGWNALINGRFIGVHIINKCEIENFTFEYQIIDLRRVYSVPFGIVKRFTVQHGNRVRLLPPYREHLAQAFARQFMRIGLPIDLPNTFLASS